MTPLGEGIFFIPNSKGVCEWKFRLRQKPNATRKSRSALPRKLVPHFEAAYKKAAPSIEIKGFRKGKVPIALIKKYYGESVEADALDDIANESFKKTIDEKKIQPIGTPTMVDMKYKTGEPFSFTIKD